MAAQIAVLIDERDRRLGKLMVAPQCAIIRHGGSFFVRTGRGVKLHHSHRAVAAVFEETEVFVREKLEPL